MKAKNLMLSVLTAAMLISCGGSTKDIANPSATSAPARTLASINEVPTSVTSILNRQRLSDRTIELTIATSSFSSPVKVEVILPVNYNVDPLRRWPVTYYVAGTNSNQTTFRVAYDGEIQTQGFNSIVVAPSGEAGYWSDWYNLGAGGPPKYETFVISELIPLIDAQFRTIPVRSQRAIMGESMGGYGALMLAARHPDKFVAAASLSGAVDTNFPTGMLINSMSPLLQYNPPDAIYGPRLTQEVRWRGHNPLDLAQNLAGMDLQVFTGNGVLGINQGESVDSLPSCALESGVILPESRNFHATLNDLAIPHYWEELNWGCHSAVLFDSYLPKILPRFQLVFGQSAPAPSTFDYRSTESQFEVYGWNVNVDSLRAMEFINLKHVSSSGFEIAGSGLTTITTPQFFHGKNKVSVRVDGVLTQNVTPDANGRVNFNVDLGPANLQQEYLPGSQTTVSVHRIDLSAN
ncbi:alpha/beta hydrolase [Massilia sp.]|uniref:alpha/beta hydrolase n=1 Tax=Massilia sp. TaxID=1882437 RepID=UPI00352C587E